MEAKVAQGNAASESKKFGDALAAYDEALKALPERHSMVADLHGRKAGVYLEDKKYASHFGVVWVFTWRRRV